MMNTPSASIVKYLKDYQPLPWLTHTVNLQIDIGDPLVQVTNTMNLEARDPNFSAPLVLNGAFVELLSVAVNGRTVLPEKIVRNSGTLTLSGLPVSCTVTLITAFDPKENLALEGLYADGDLLVTQCEPEGFRRITYFMDRPDNLSVYTVTLTADKKRYPLLLSNGNQIRQENLPDGRHSVTWLDPFPKPSYLFAAVAGDLGAINGIFRTQSGRSIALSVFVPRGKEERGIFALDCLKKAMSWDEERFGLECDLDRYMIVTTDAFNAGAMENKGLNIFNSSCVLADAASATDADFQSIDRVIAHEYFHNWTGNRVTCRDWFQLTLKEGLTVFRDAEYTADTFPGIARIRDIRNLREGQFAEDGGPLAHPIRPESYVEINNFYTTTVYKKGAEVIRMIQTFAGREKFRAGMDIYFDLFDGKAVTTDDFIRAMELGTGLDLTQFKRWYTQAGTPELAVSDHFDPVTGLYTLTVEQSCRSTAECSKKLPFHFPLKFALLDPLTGKEICLGTDLLDIHEVKQTFSFAVGGKSAPIPSLLRDFSAPVILRCPYTDEALAFLSIHDTNLFCAYEAAQELMKRALLSPDSPADKAAKQAWARILSDFKRHDPAYIAMILIPPTLQALCADLTEVNYPALSAARSHFMTAVSEKNEALLRRILEEMTVEERYVPSVEQAAKRALCGTILLFLSFLEDTALPLLCDRFHHADNMTDRMASLHLLAHSPHPEAENCLALFRERWEGDALVMNKWFAVQAASRRPDLLQRLNVLEKESCFDNKNPNKIGALYGNFVRNLPQYHRPDGEAYAWIAERIAAIDAFNPQAASGLAKSAFSALEKLCEPQQSRMRGVLMNLRNTQSLSPNLSEILNRILLSRS